MAEADPGRERPLQEFRYNMAAIEERFIGSTPPDLGGRDVPEILDEVMETNNPALWTLLLQPTFLKRGQRTIEQVRQARSERYEQGTLVFLGQAGIMMDLEGLSPRFYYSDVDPATGLIIPSWRVSLVNEHREELPVEEQAEFLSTVQLRGSYGRHYTFTPNEQGIYRLQLNRPQSQNPRL